MQCSRGQPALIGYKRCLRCQSKRLHLVERRGLKGRVLGRHLYVAQTPCGFKVGWSSYVDRRMGEVKLEMFADVDGDVELVKAYEGKGRLEVLVHYALSEYVVPCFTEIFNCDVPTISAAIDRVIAEDLALADSQSSALAPDSVIVVNTVRSFLKGLPEPVHCGAEAMAAVNAKLVCILEEAAQRARAEGRVTLMKHDI